MMKHYNATHGMSATSTYRAWSKAKGRCHNPRDNRYEYYGGRGIVMCDRWRDSFENFLADMGEKPPGTSIDRVDNDGPYSPENCRWATQKQQCRNYRRCVSVEWEGRTFPTIKEFAKHVGLPRWRLTRFISDYGMAPADAVERAKYAAHHPHSKPPVPHGNACNS